MKTKTQKRWSLAANIILTISSLLAILPFILLVIASFTDEEVAMNDGFSYLPAKLSMAAFGYIGQQWAMIGRAYLMTIIVTAIGTGASVVMTAMLAYMLSQRKLPGRKILNFLVVFTMLFNGGLVPTYIMYVRIFHLKNSIGGLIVPNLMLSGFMVMLVRNYFENSIPEELYEASRIDGAGEFYNFFHIALPLSVPILATSGLMTGLAYWNDWQNGLYYLDSKGAKLYTVQNILNNINENIQFLASNATGGVNVGDLPTTTVRMAIALVGILPVLIIYPFFQKYFAKGLTMGAVKG
ncbi:MULTISPECIES: carbohydrate ABC transporter permease [unclassified Butyrivibrio]|uniref:carbohydrate ABC transporter permease n=1 Tax=unclassified Butyrivibrio TaxID=2639466 RepID=UPI00047E731F|nr:MULTISPECIES: carbohydrate ABC transporter permease [unclassified Butyrivibrio]